MIDVPYAVKRALKDGNRPKQYRFQVLNDDETVDFTIDNDTLVKESVKIDERMCSGDRLKFGLCEGASLEFQYFNHPNIRGRRVKVYLDVAYDNEGTEAYYPLSMGYFDVDQCSTQFSTGIIKAVAYNKLRSSYLDQKCNDSIVEAAQKGDVGTPNNISIGTLLQNALNGYSIEPEYERLPIEVTHHWRMDLASQPWIMSVSLYSANDIKACYKKVGDQYVPISGHDGSSYNNYLWPVFCILSIRAYDSGFNGFLRFGAKFKRIIEIAHDALIQNEYAGDDYYLWVQEVGEYINPVDYWLYHAGIEYDPTPRSRGQWSAYASYIYNDSNYTISTAEIDTLEKRKDDEEYHVKRYGKLENESGGTAYENYYGQICVPVAFCVDTLQESGSSPVAARVYREVLEEHQTEWESIYDAVYQQVYSDVLMWAEKRVDSEMEQITFTTAQAEALPDVTLRELQSAVYETSALYGQLDRDTDLFYGVELNSGSLTPSVSLYPSATLYPNQGYGSNIFRPFPSEYQKLWTDSVGEQTFRYLIITYKAIEYDQQGNPTEVDKTLQRTVHEHGTTNYNCSDNWLFRNLVWTAEQVGAYADAMVEKMLNIRWFPFEMWSTGLPYVEVGDAIEIADKEGDTHISYVLQRQLNGVQNLQDTYINGTLDIF